MQYKSAHFSMLLLKEGIVEMAYKLGNSIVDL